MIVFEDNLLLGLPFILYAETHYRFRFLFSLLWKNEPEIVADAPRRLEPGQKLPLLLLAKDGHRYPAVLKSVRVRLRTHNAHIEIHPLRRPVQLNKKWWWNIYRFDTGELKGWVEVDTDFEIESNGRTSRYSNDNYRTSSKKPLRVYIASHSLPGNTRVHYGDLHTHSNYTDDQVEYGAPLDASRQLAKATGLSFFGATDHSYDLDDSEDSFLINDPALPKWTRLHAEIDAINRTSKDFVILRGEEVSCRSNSGKNVHLVLLGHREFEPGSGDGAERWFRTRSESSIREILSRRSADSICIAAHPAERVSFLQRLLIGRGTWSQTDIESAHLTGIQFLNGHRQDGFHKGLASWRRALLKGRRLIAVAGNDAHGNFNRFRQISLPFIRLRESPHQIFGEMKTGILVKRSLCEEEILDAVRGGRCIVTDGPFGWMSASDEWGNRAEIGGQVRPGRATITITLESTPEFGEWNHLRLFLGIIGETTETLVFSRNLSGWSRMKRDIELLVLRPSYVRAEMTTSRGESDGIGHFCLTNPIWFS